jgi:cytidylate kinase
MDKTAIIDILTGRMGSGITTLSKQIAPKYDLVMQTDFPRPMNEKTGKYDEPTKQEKEQIRADRRSQVLKASQEGKKVLVEGHPPGVVKLMREDLPKVDRILLIPTTVEKSFERVAQRAKEDPKEFDFLTEMDSAVHNNKNFDHYMERIQKAGIPVVEIEGPHKPGKVKEAAEQAPAPKHVDFLDQHFTTDDRSKWRSFRARLKDPGFVSAVKQDTRSDQKLKNFSEMIGRHDRSDVPSVTVHGVGGDYKVKYHPDIDRFSCDCGNWTYKQSVKHNKRSDCKHIRLVKSQAMRAGEPMQKKAGKISSIIRNLPIPGLANAVSGSIKNESDAEKMKATNQMYAAVLKKKNLLKEASLRGAVARLLLSAK